MTEVRKMDRETLEILHQQEIDGTIKPEHQKILDRARQLGSARELELFERLTKGLRTPTSQIIGTVGAELLGESAGGKAAQAVPPVRAAAKGSQAITGLMKLLGIAGGNVAGQAVTSPDPIDPNQTGLATGFGAAGQGIHKLITKGRNLFRPSPPTLERTPGVNQLESSAALQSAERLLAKGVVPRASMVVKNQLLKIVDAIASSAPFSRGTMRAQKESIQKFYENAAEGFSKHFVENTSKLEISTLAREIIENDVNFALTTRTRNYQALDEVSEGINAVDLSSLGKGDVTFLEAGILLEKASDKEFRIIRKQMRKGVDDVIESHPDDISININEMRELGLDSAENLKFVEELNKAGGDKAALAKNLKKKIDTALLFSEKKMRKMKKSFLEEMIKKKPEAFLDAFINPKGPRSLKSAMDLLPKKLKHKIQSHFIGKLGDRGRGGLLNKATIKTDAGRILDGSKLVDEIDKFEKGFGHAMGQAMFPVTGLKPLRQLGNELEAIVSKEAGGPGSTAIFLMTPGAGITLGGFAASGFSEPSVGIATAAGVLFLPKLAARKLNDPKFVKNLIRGLKKHSADDLKMQKFMTLLSTQLTAEGINSQFVPGDPATSPEEARIGGSTSLLSPTSDIF